MLLLTQTKIDIIMSNKVCVSNLRKVIKRHKSE